MTVLCTQDALVVFVTRALVAIGMPARDARPMAQVVVAADLAGHESCGLRQLRGYVDAVRSGGVDPAARPVIDLDRGALLRVDGRTAFGHVTFRYVVDLVVQRVRQHGVCAVAVHRTHHLGRVADFCDLAAQRGVVTLFFLNQSGAGQVVVPYGGTGPRLATNPVAAGVPRAEPGGPHLVLDMATSAVAAGRLAEHRDRGDADPAGWVTADGLLTAAGGAKGFGLALVAEALAGALTGAGTVGAPGPADAQAALVVGVDAAAFRPLADVTADLERALDHVRADVPADPAAAVRIPGETGAATSAARRAGGIPVQEHTWRAIRRLAAELGVDPPAPRA